MGCFSGAVARAVGIRQAPTREGQLVGRTTASLGVEKAPTPAASHACGTWEPRQSPDLRFDGLVGRP